jgi:hypothetical protein
MRNALQWRHRFGVNIVHIDMADKRAGGLDERPLIADTVCPEHAARVVDRHGAERRQPPACFRQFTGSQGAHRAGIETAAQRRAYRSIAAQAATHRSGVALEKRFHVSVV